MYYCLNPWIFNGTLFSSKDIDNYVGFVYCIYGPERSYIGRKYFWNLRKKPNAKKHSKRKKTESDWKDYYGSSQVLSEDIRLLGNQAFRREIISLHTTRGDVNYMEAKLQFTLNVLEEDKYYNDNILIKYKTRPQHIVEGRNINVKWQTRV